MTSSNLLKLHIIGHSPRSRCLSFVKAPGKEDCNAKVPVVTGQQKDHFPPAGARTQDPSEGSGACWGGLSCPGTPALELRPPRTQWFIWHWLHLMLQQVKVLHVSEDFQKAFADLCTCQTEHR